MSSRTRLTTTGIAAAALLVALAGCSGSTVEGEAPEVSTEITQSSPTESSNTFAQERPEKPSSPVSPPPSSERGPAPEREPEPAPEPQPEPDLPGSGDFVGLLEQQGVVLADGVDPVATARESCERFDRGEQMIGVSEWLAEHGGLDTEQQGFFLGAAIGTYCPENFAKLG